MSIYIYVLREKGNPEVRYVGQSVHPETRLYQHFSENKRKSKRLNHPLRKWMDSICILEMEVIEKCRNELAADREHYWENHFRGRGDRLTNLGSAKKSAYRRYLSYGKVADDFKFEKTSVFMERVIRLIPDPERDNSGLLEQRVDELEQRVKVLEMWKEEIEAQRRGR